MCEKQPPYFDGEGNDPSFDAAWELSHDTDPDKFASSSVVSQPSLNLESDYPTEIDIYSPHQEISQLPRAYGISEHGLKDPAWSNEDIIQMIPDFLADEPKFSGELYMVTDGYQGGREIGEYIQENFPVEFGTALTQYLKLQESQLEQPILNNENDTPPVENEHIVDDAVINTAEQVCSQLQNQIEYLVNSEEIQRSQIPQSRKREDRDYGTTMTAVYINKQTHMAYIIQVGDSPVFTVDNDGIVSEVTTSDHNWGASLKESFRAKGGFVNPFLNFVSLTKTSRIFMGSDSLKKGGLKEDIARIKLMSDQSFDLKAHIQELVDYAQSGKDHMSGIGIQFP